MKYGDVVLYRATKDTTLMAALVLRSAINVPHLAGKPIEGAEPEELLDLAYLDPEASQKVVSIDSAVKTAYAVRPAADEAGVAGYAVIHSAAISAFKFRFSSAEWAQREAEIEKMQAEQIGRQEMTSGAIIGAGAGAVAGAGVKLPEPGELPRGTGSGNLTPEQQAELDALIAAGHPGTGAPSAADLDLHAQEQEAIKATTQTVPVPQTSTAVPDAPVSEDVAQAEVTTDATEETQAAAEQEVSNEPAAAN